MTRAQKAFPIMLPHPVGKIFTKYRPFIFFNADYWSGYLKGILTGWILVSILIYWWGSVPEKPWGTVLPGPINSIFWGTWGHNI